MAMPKDPLYAVAYLEWKPKTRTWADGMDYMHAKDVGEARAKFCAMNPNRKTHRIIAIGPAIGWFVESYNGQTETLVAD